jgi:hypothetical protein
VIFRRQSGQSMVEYTMVVTSLVTLILLSNQGCEGYDSCISKLLTTMHDNYDGYSSSMSAVHKYGDYEVKGTPVEGGGRTGGGNSGGDGGTDGGVNLNPDGITEVSQVMSGDGYTTFGTLQPDGTVLDSQGNIIGTYSDVNQTITLANGNVSSVNLRKVVIDEDGNILYLRAVTDILGNVYSWGYLSKATGEFSNSLNLEKMDITGYISQPSFKVVKIELGEEVEQPGRILNGEYYAAIFTTEISTTPLNPSGEVIYWDDLDICSVMVVGWDDDVDTSQSDEDIYSDQLIIFSDDDKNLGRMDYNDYLEQTSFDGVATEPNDCPSARVITQP